MGVARGRARPASEGAASDTKSGSGGDGSATEAMPEGRRLAEGVCPEARMGVASATAAQSRATGRAGGDDTTMV